VVYKLSPGGIYSVLHSFNHFDGAAPYAGLIADKRANLYGTTAAGGGVGGLSPCRGGCGVLFKLSAGRAYKVLHFFSGPTGDGANPYAGVYADSNGNLFGTTSGGGAFGKGAVFEVTGAGFIP
jgi:uncharacterized repeat protein (TIGR03803 family)